MKQLILTTPPGFARVQGPKGRIFYKPLHDWIYTLHHKLVRDLGNPKYPNQFECVRPHLRRRFLLKLDLSHAFNTITAFRANRYADIYFKENEEYFFHENGGLIQGAPASPTIFHLYCQEMLDPELNYYCKQQGINMTRYVDDILISSYHPISEQTQNRIQQIMMRSEFVVNIKKTLYVDNKFQSITFVGIRIFKHKVQTSKTFQQKLLRANSSDKNYTGLQSWNDNVLALNQ